VSSRRIAYLHIDGAWLELTTAAPSTSVIPN
jgi:hypothetical protein